MTQPVAESVPFAFCQSPSVVAGTPVNVVVSQFAPRPPVVWYPFGSSVGSTN